jgi:hypothetical protein
MIQEVFFIFIILILSIFISILINISQNYTKKNITNNIIILNYYVSKCNRSKPSLDDVKVSYNKLYVLTHNFLLKNICLFIYGETLIENILIILIKTFKIFEKNNIKVENKFEASDTLYKNEELKSFM